MEKLYVSAEELLRASYELAWQVYESGFRPDYIIGIWRGGAPVGIAIQEFFDLMGVFSDHIDQFILKFPFFMSQCFSN